MMDFINEHQLLFVFLLGGLTVYVADFLMPHFLFSNQCTCRKHINGGHNE